MRLTTLQDTVEQLRDLLDEEEAPVEAHEIASFIEGLHSSDIAFVLNNLPTRAALLVFELLDPEEAAEVLGEVSRETVRYLLQHTSPERAAAIMPELPTDDAAEIVSGMGGRRGQALLEHLPAEDAAEVRELLSYPEQTAGRLMIDTFASVSPEASRADILRYVKNEGRELETVNDVYVVDEGGRLLGVASLREVIYARDDMPIRSYMVTNAISVTPETDQQEVARLIARYNLLALPVLDASGEMLGIVTVDDVIDVLVEEFTEDYLRLVGSDADEMDRRSPWQVVKIRIPWLMGTMLIELFAGVVISRYDWVLTQVILLASFMPVISAISGNVGLQAAAIIVRGLDTGHVTLQNWWKAVRKELTASFIMAMICGVVLGGVGVYWSGRATFGVVIGGAMTCSMLAAGFMGTVIPMISKRLGFDPAATAGPFETAFQDVVGFGVFLWLASELMHWLH